MSETTKKKRTTTAAPADTRTYSEQQLAEIAKNVESLNKVLTAMFIIMLLAIIFAALALLAQ